MTRPRLGFLGVGWIGRHRMQAMIDHGDVEIAAICDPAADMAEAASRLAPGAALAPSLDAMLDLGLDGLVIATPSALHAEQSIRALERGVAVFCQKPLGRTAAEVRTVVDAARAADRLLAVDLSYRFTDAARRIAALIRDAALGPVFAADLVFHNAYGPDKPWFRDKAQSGGGCVTDLGVHLVDLALWLLDWPEVAEVNARLFAGGKPLPTGADTVEDYAEARITLAGGAVIRLACSWNLHAGRDAVIAANFYGSRGGASLRNVAGSFYDFIAEHHAGTATTELAAPPDDWGGRAAVEWARRLTRSARFDLEADRLIDVADVLDKIYARVS